jgi:hypothetical protein
MLCTPHLDDNLTFVGEMCYRFNLWCKKRHVIVARSNRRSCLHILINHGGSRNVAWWREWNLHSPLTSVWYSIEPHAQRKTIRLTIKSRLVVCPMVRCVRYVMRSRDGGGARDELWDGVRRERKRGWQIVSTIWLFYYPLWNYDEDVSILPQPLVDTSRDHNFFPGMTDHIQSWQLIW